ncbi:DUF2268 domain-containing protein [Vibrio sp.]|nr:DUF2268 domain-containing protein [Vibrio sp.]
MSVQYEVTEQLSSLKNLIINKIELESAQFQSIFDDLQTKVMLTCFKEGGMVAPSGIGGYAFSEDSVEIYIDDSRDDIERIIEKDLMFVIGHELNHSLRFKCYGRGERLGDTIIDEGLACYFEYLLAGKKQPDFLTCSIPWLDIYDKVKSSWDTKDFSYPLFYFGEFPEFLPRYASYIVGFHLVKGYLESNDLSLVDVMTYDSERFLESV